MLAQEDAAGQAWCRANGYGGYTSYASLADLPRRASAFAALKTRLDRHARAYAEALSLDLGSRRLRLDDIARLTGSIARVRPFIIADGWRPTLLAERADLEMRLKPRAKQLELFAA